MVKQSIRQRSTKNNIYQRRYEEKWKRVKAELIGKLSDGRGCALCGSFKNLEIDHCDGRNYVLNKISSATRTKKYLEEYESGVPLRVLCRKCNALSGGGVRYGKNRSEHEPEAELIDEITELDLVDCDEEYLPSHELNTNDDESIPF